MMVIPIVIGVLGTVTKGLVQGLEDLGISRRVKTIQTTALLRSARILRSVLENLRGLAVTQTPMINYQLTSVWKTQKGIIIIIIIIIIRRRRRRRRRNNENKKRL